MKETGITAAIGLVGLAIGWMIGWGLMSLAHGADLRIPLPKPRPEACLQAGREPLPGQTLQADKTCPTGMRWKFQK